MMYLGYKLLKRSDVSERRNCTHVKLRCEQERRREWGREREREIRLGFLQKAQFILKPTFAKPKEQTELKKKQRKENSPNLPLLKSQTDS